MYGCLSCVSLYCPELDRRPVQDIHWRYAVYVYVSTCFDQLEANTNCNKSRNECPSNIQSTTNITAVINRACWCTQSEPVNDQHVYSVLVGDSAMIPAKHWGI
ncbi:hypothetical protein AMECASPLE_032445 [Ameca splendens]|uniref:Uncharacterized protein n=1 Tax=Ameca splendens TaxID=208324 RepID=A0ABV1AE56_9TELE